MNTNVPEDTAPITPSKRKREPQSDNGCKWLVEKVIVPLLVALIGAIAIVIVAIFATGKRTPPFKLSTRFSIQDQAAAA